MLIVDIIICKGIVINLYDITVAINFFYHHFCRERRALARTPAPLRVRLCIYRYAIRDTQYAAT